MQTNSTVIREQCLRCGMVANLDPECHHERYGHRPVVERDGDRLRFDYGTNSFQLFPEGPCDWCGKSSSRCFC